MCYILKLLAVFMVYIVNSQIYKILALCFICKKLDSYDKKYFMLETRIAFYIRNESNSNFVSLPCCSESLETDDIFMSWFNVSQHLIISKKSHKLSKNFCQSYLKLQCMTLGLHRLMLMPYFKMYSVHLQKSSYSELPKISLKRQL